MIDLHADFRNILILLQLLTAINNDGRPVLKHSYTSGYEAQFNTEIPDAAILLNAIAGIHIKDFHIASSAIRTRSDSQSESIVTMTTESELNTIEDLRFHTNDIQGFTLIYNADTSQESQTSDYQLVIGKSNFDLISNTDWECLKIPQDEPVEHHAATIEDFMKRYNAIDSTNEHAQSELFHGFTRYLIASCWKRMWRRAIHWSSLGFLYILGSLDEKCVRGVFNASLIGPTERKDSALATMLQQSIGLLDCVGEEYRTPDGLKTRPDFTLLSSKLNDASVKSPYDDTTCFQFHQLLVATLLGYTSSLALFAEAMNKSGDPEPMVKKRELLAQEFLLFSRLLWRIAYSQIFLQHLTMLAAAGVLRLPSDDEIMDYESYAGFTSPLVPPPVHMAGTTGDESLVEDMEEFEFVDEFENGEDGLPVELKEKADLTANDEMVKAVSKRIRLLLSHWGGLDIISAFSNSRWGNIQDMTIALISVKSPSSRGSSIGDWKDIIRGLASCQCTSDASGTKSHSFDPEVVIETIESRIESGATHFPNSKIIKAFNSVRVSEKSQKPQKPSKKSKSSSIPPQPSKKFIKFFGSIHCEAALGLLKILVLLGIIPGDSPLAHIIKQSNSNLIGVSKPCCPVCWDLYTHLRHQSALRLSLRKRHPTLSALELPPLLPQDILQKMVHTYKDYLCHQIEQMLIQGVSYYDGAKSESRHRRTYSEESNSAMSIASNKSGSHQHGDDERWPSVRSGPLV